MSYYKPPADKLRRLIEMRNFTATVSQVQRDAERTTMETPSEEQIAQWVIDEVPLIDVKETPFNRVLLDQYETRGRDIDKTKGECHNVWTIAGDLIALASTPGTEPMVYQLRPSLIDPELARYEDF